MTTKTTKKTVTLKMDAATQSKFAKAIDGLSEVANAIQMGLDGSAPRGASKRK